MDGQTDGRTDGRTEKLIRGGLGNYVPPGKDVRYMFIYVFLNFPGCFEPLGSSRQQTDKYIAPGGMFFMFLCIYKPIGASPLTKCRFSHSLFWLRRILGGMGGGGLKKGGNAWWAMESQRCKSSASRESFQHRLLH